MTPLVAVLVAGAILGLAAPLVLGRLARLDRAPQAAAYLWLMATVGALSAVVLAGLLLIVGSSRLLGDLAVLLATCTMALRAALDAPTGMPGPLLGLGLLTVVAGGVLGGGLVAGARARHAARGQRELLALAGRSQPGLLGVTVLDHPVPLAYCLPRGVGRRTGPVVVTTATLEHLDPGQLAAVLAHERAHQARAHHALLLAAQALHIGFPWLPTARAAHRAVARLVELAADDAATHRHNRADVAAARQARHRAGCPPWAWRWRADQHRTRPPAHQPARQRPGRCAACGRAGRGRPGAGRAGRADRPAAASRRHPELPADLTGAA